MRKTVVSFHNNQLLEVFVEKHHDFSEVWITGPVKETRMVLEHHLTHDDLEQCLEYALPGDLVWRDTTPSEIPKEIHPVARHANENIKRGVFSDYGSVHRLLALHVLGIINVPSLDRKALSNAKKVMLGPWFDGIATLDFEPNAKLRWSCPLDQPHPLNLGFRKGGYLPDWWGFASWQLHLMNNEHKSGMRIAVLHVDDEKLHVVNQCHPRRLAYVFHRP